MKPARKPRAKPAGEPPKRRKVTMLLDADLARRLRLTAVARGEDIGQIAGPAIEQAIGGCYFVDKTAGRAGAEPAADPEREDGQDGPRLAAVAS